VNIINHSVAWFGAAFYDGTGPLCDVTDSAESAGIQWFNAMGNSRTAHYLSAFSDTDSDLRHNFSSNVNSNTVSLNQGSSFSLILNWDNYASYDVDYNLYLYNGDPDAGGTLVASSQNVQNGRRTSAPPYEIISYQAPTTATYYIVVTKANSSVADLPLSLFTTGPSLGLRTYSTSLSQPADCNSVISVGAVNLTDDAEGFSSEGPTTDGRNKPEISAPDRTVTSLSTSFVGTSGASPHAAGAAAILLSQNPAYTLVDIKTLLINNSHDVSSTGFDYRTGYGRISLDADQDNINHDDDNCLLILNFDQQDVDADGLGDVCDVDIDGDGLSNSIELTLGTDPYLADTDTDGLSDGDEVSVYFTMPLLADTDMDGFIDGDEIFVFGSNPNVSNLGHLSPKNSPDDLLDVSDLLILLRLIDRFEVADTYENIAGDMNLDGVIDVRDALLLMQKLGY
ncbi:MAG: S8 family peptidase, partial [Gammaproteobacteria bacterium]|nr:S8 family peptidase [Gammaproteobacteria bacterium]